MTDLEETVNEIFRVYDRNNNNYLEIKEVVLMLNDGANVIGKDPITSEEVTTFLELFDRNKDGKLSRV